MIYLDVDDLNARFWTCELSYKNDDGETVVLSDSQKLVENQPDEEIDATQPYVRWTIEPGASVQKVNAGPHMFRSVGTAYLQVFVPKGMGTGPATDLVDCFHNHFRKYRSEDTCLRVLSTDQRKGNDKKFFDVKASFAYESNRS
ncbi:hypothetical protein [Sphingobium yanoikuyae]